MTNTQYPNDNCLALYYDLIGKWEKMIQEFIGRDDVTLTFLMTQSATDWIILAKEYHILFYDREGSLNWVSLADNANSDLKSMVDILLDEHRGYSVYGGNSIVNYNF